MLFLYQKYIKKELKEKVACTGCKLKLQLQKAVVTTIDKLGVKEENGVQLTFFPASVYAYAVGRNTLIQKKQQLF